MTYAASSRRALFICAAATLVLTFAFAGTAIAGGKGGKTGKATVSLRTSKQADLTGNGEVGVGVKAPSKKTTVKGKLALKLMQGGDTTPIAKSTKIKTKKGKASALIAINAKGQPLVRSCLKTKLEVVLTYKAKKGKSGRTKRQAKKVSVKDFTIVKRDPGQCTGTIPVGVDPATADRCDPISPPGQECLFPYPNDYYTKPDTSTPTGLRLNVDPASTPTNAGDSHVDPTEINTSDGFSPGAPLVVRVPGLDTPEAFAQTAPVPITDMGKSFDANQPIVVIDTATGQRQLIWTELDSNATSPGTTDLLIHFGKNLQDGHHYVVAIRNLKDAGGSTLMAPNGFQLFRDKIPTDIPAIENRRAHFEDVFSDLGSAGIGRDDLYMAWDFTVASTQSMTGRMLSMRDQAFADLGDTNLTDGTVQGNSPQFTIDPGGITDYPTATGRGVEDIRQVEGTVQVPCFMTDPDGTGPAGPCDPGAVLNLDDNGVPLQNGTYNARFGCNIPRSAVNETSPGVFDVDHKVRTSLYGHGLFGEYKEALRSQNVRQLGTENGIMTCAADFIGMADEDVGPVAVPALVDMSNFKPLPDRLQQGFLDFLYLGRAMIHPNGFTADPAFQFSGHSVVDTTKPLFYYGNSQGGIAGGALTAIATDLTRSVLYVPGMNYSTLLTRSIDFEDYSLILYPSYPDEQARPLLLTLIQGMWDRGEPDGYANHMTTDPLPNTPAHKVLIEMAYGDHQVANVQTGVEARTIGAPLRMPAVDANRLPPGFDAPFVGLQTLGDLSGPAADGSGYFIWDIGPKRTEVGVDYGTNPPPITNTPPDDTFGVDPHDTVIEESPLIRAQIASFIDTNGKITNPPEPACGTHPCYAAGWNGAP